MTEHTTYLHVKEIEHTYISYYASKSGYGIDSLARTIPVSNICYGSKAARPIEVLLYHKPV